MFANTRHFGVYNTPNYNNISFCNAGHSRTQLKVTHNLIYLFARLFEYITLMPCRHHTKLYIYLYTDLLWMCNSLQPAAARQWTLKYIICGGRKQNTAGWRLVESFERWIKTKVQTGPSAEKWSWYFSLRNVPILPITADFCHARMRWLSALVPPWVPGSGRESPRVRCIIPWLPRT